MIPTREHWRIEKWAHEQGAIPAQIVRRSYDGEPAILTFIFGKGMAGYPEIHLITWESFFAQFDLLQLSMTFDENSPQFSIVKVEKRSAAYPQH